MTIPGRGADARVRRSRRLRPVAALVVLVLGLTVAGVLPPSHIASASSATAHRVVGDFNGDGYPDLAIGASSYNGAVYVLYGSATGLSTTGSQHFLPNSPGMPKKARAAIQTNFGFSLATGDFNHDGRADLAIGMPFYDQGCCGGAVTILYGSATGLTTVGSRFLHSPVDYSATAADGFSMAAGDFNHDGFDDLAVGAPIDKTSQDRAGAVSIAYGSATGLTRTQEFTEDTPGMAGLGVATAFADYFGFALAAGDFNGDGFTDVAISVMHKSETIVLYGSASGITLTGGQVLPGVDWSWAVAAGDFNHDGFADLAVGEPCATVKQVHGAGMVELHSGSASGLGSVAYRTATELYTSKSGMPAVPSPAPMLFGEAVAAGDVNGDGRADLAIAAPVGTTGTYLLRGAGTQVGTKSSQFLRSAQPEGGSQSLGMADFNGDGFADIAIGSPDEMQGQPAPYVEVHNGANVGLTSVNPGSAPSFNEGSAGMPVPPDPPGTQNFFGQSLSAPGSAGVGSCIP